MADTFGNVDVDTDATQIIAAYTQRKGILISNNGTAIIYLGYDDSVTALTGYPMLPKSQVEMSSTLTVRKHGIWAIAASGTQDVRYLTWDA